MKILYTALYLFIIVVIVLRIVKPGEFLVWYPFQN